MTTGVVLERADEHIQQPFELGRTARASRELTQPLETLLHRFVRSCRNGRRARGR